MNAYGDNPVRGLSKLQKRILASLIDADGKYRVTERPEHFRKTLCMELDQDGNFVWVGTSGSSFSRAVTRFVRRGLVKRTKGALGGWHSIELTEIGRTCLTVLEYD